MTGEARSREHLLQRLSIAIHKGSVVAVHGMARRSGELNPFWE